MTEPAHHRLGPSSSERWIHCTRSHLATLEVLDVDTDYAMTGSGAHGVAEHCRRANIKAEAWPGTHILVKRVDGGHEKILVDKQMRDGVQAFMDYVNDLPGDDYNEERVYYRIGWRDLDLEEAQLRQLEGDDGPYPPEPEYAFGTMDAAKATWETLNIVDLKYGEGVQVFAKNNTQLMLYALGFIEKYGWLYNFKKIRLHVFQPRLDHIDVWEITPEELEKWAEEVMRPAAKEAIQGSGKFVPGDQQCRFCKIKKTCAARAKYVFDVAAGEMDDLDVQIQAPLKTQAELTRAQISAALKRKKHVVQWFTDLESFVYSELMHGRPVEDWKIVEGRSNRAWAVSEAEVLRRIEEMWDAFDKSKLYTEPKLLTAPAVEGVVGAALFKPATKTKPAGPLADLIMKPKGSPVLAPGTDPRESMRLDANEEMNEVEEEL